jgi:hypothetical protein
MAGDDPIIQDPLSTPISTDNAAARAADLEQARTALAETHRVLQAKERQATTTLKQLEIRRKELESIADYNRKLASCEQAGSRRETYSKIQTR